MFLPEQPIEYISNYGFWGYQGLSDIYYFKGRAIFLEMHVSTSITIGYVSNNGFWSYQGLFDIFQ